MKFHKSYIFTFLLVLPTLAVLPVRAASFPSKPVQIIVALSPGGPTDIIARTLSARLSEMWKVPVVVDNKPGAAGAIAAAYVLNAPADGHTLLMTATTHIQAIGLKMKLSYDPVADFLPITQVAIAPLVFMVREDGPKSLSEFVSRAKQERLSYASFGPASTAHIYGELLNRVAKIDVTNVPYKGGTPAVSAVLGGDVASSFVEGSQARTYAASGRLRPLAVTGNSRYSQLPDVKTFAELGYQGFELVGWHGIFAPKGTPLPLADKLATDIRAVIKDPVTQRRFTELGVEPVGNTPEEWRSIIKNDTAKWTSLIEKAGIKAQ